MNEKHEQQEIDLGRLFRALKKWCVLIVAVALVAAVIGFLYTDNFVTPKYEVEARAVLSFGSTSSENLINSSTITYGDRFIGIFSQIYTSSSILDPVVEKLSERGIEISYEELRSLIKIESVDETQMIKMTVRHPDKEVAMAIVEEVFAVGQAAVDKTLTDGKFYVTDKPRLANHGNPVSPEPMKNAALCGILALVALAAVVIVCEIFNNKIKSEEDLESVLGVPVIGKIPSADEKAGKKYGYGE